MEGTATQASKLEQIWHLTAFGDVTWQMMVMWAIIALLFYLAIYKKFEPLLLIPIAFGALLANPAYPRPGQPAPRRRGWRSLLLHFQRR